MTPDRLTAELLRGMPLPQPKEGSKDHRGSVLVIAGSVEVPGAALLAANAALRAGAGKLQVATVRSAAMNLAMAVPEAMVIGLDETREGGIEHRAALPRLRSAAEKVDAVMIGAGMVECEETTALTAALCREASSAFVLDAAALCDLRPHSEAIRACAGSVVITPHAGEMAQFLEKSRDEIEADPLGAARETSALLQAVVVMKGAKTHIVSSDGTAWLFSGGTVGLATSGSGDVLAGLIVGLLARGADPVTAASWGVVLHGEAGQRLQKREGELGFLARDLAAEFPPILQEIA